MTAIVVLVSLTANAVALSKIAIVVLVNQLASVATSSRE